MTARVIFELSADLDVDCEAAEELKRDLISLVMDRRETGGYCRKTHQERKIQLENGQKWTQADTFVGCALPTPTDPRCGFMV